MIPTGAKGIKRREKSAAQKKEQLLIQESLLFGADGAEVTIEKI
jgi:hypothetical protein